MLTSILINFQDFVINFFHKEGLFIQFVLCVCFFVIASILAIWAIKTGQFKDAEGDVRFDVFDEDELKMVLDGGLK